MHQVQSDQDQIYPQLDLCPQRTSLLEPYWHPFQQIKHKDHQVRRTSCKKNGLQSNSVVLVKQNLKQIEKVLITTNQKFATHALTWPGKSSGNQAPSCVNYLLWLDV